MNKQKLIFTALFVSFSAVLFVGFQNFTVSQQSDTFLGRGGAVNSGQNVYAPSVIFQNGIPSISCTMVGSRILELRF